MYMDGNGLPFLAMTAVAKQAGGRGVVMRRGLSGPRSGSAAPGRRVKKSGRAGTGKR